LNEGVRPFTTRWHRQLAAYEENIGSSGSDRSWPDRVSFDEELEQLQEQLMKYLEVLARMAGIAPHVGTEIVGGNLGPRS
ncbi:MAG: hypothetical protein QOE58_2740, partial [Actinomycetota bacterium]|nr:hypothetical protein [Actinomycetota bacterium]